MAKRVSGGGLWTAEYAQRLLERWEQSGQSLASLLRHVGAALARER